MNSTFTCEDCGNVMYAKMDYKLHRYPFGSTVVCPKIKPIKLPFVSKYAPQPKHMYCDPKQEYKVVVSSDEVSSYKIEEKWLKEKEKVSKIISNYYKK